MRGMEFKRKKVEKVSQTEKVLEEKIERIEEAGERWREQRKSMEFGGKKEEPIEKIDEIEHEGIYKDNGNGNLLNDDRNDNDVANFVPPVDRNVGSVGMEAMAGLERLEWESKKREALFPLDMELLELKLSVLRETDENEKKLLIRRIQEKIELINAQEKEMEELKKSQTKNLDMMVER